MSKQHENIKMKRLVPKLRFPEFRDANKWEEKSLGQVAKIITGNTPQTAELSNYGGNRLFVSPADISDQRYVTTTKKTLSNQGFEKTRSIKENSILFVCIGSTIGKIAQNKFECATNQQINSVIPFNKYSNNFIYSFLENNSKKIAVIAGNQAVPIINKTLFSSIAVLCPSELEQQKIADCLSSIDELITAHTQKHEVLKAHKKGLMQQLFPATGETVPKLRFPEFQDAGEWDIKKAREIFSNRAEHGEDKLPIYSVTINNGLKIRSSLDRKIDNILKSSGNKKANKYDIVYNMMRMWQGASGVAIEDCMVSPAYVVLMPNDTVCSDFYGFFFKVPQCLQLLTSHSQGLTKDRLRLYFKDFCQISLPFPHVSEQKKIANCLSSIDNLITTQAKKIESLKAHKKGLMQQLFPSTNEEDE